MLNTHDRRNVPSYQYPKRVKGREIQPYVFRIHFPESSVPAPCLQMTNTAIWTTRGKPLGIAVYFRFVGFGITQCSALIGWGGYDGSVKMFDVSDLKLALPPPPIIRPYSQAVTKITQNRF